MTFIFLVLLQEYLLTKVRLIVVLQRFYFGLVFNLIDFQNFIMTSTNE